jgi:hypothetical protein
MPKQREFDMKDPLVVAVHKHDGVWDIHATSGNGHHQKMKNRLDEKDARGKPLRETIVADYTPRKRPGAPNDLPFQNDPNHPPITIREGETVMFVCDPPFAFSITMERDPNVNANLAAPNSPFGWIGPQSVPPGGAMLGTVLMPPLDSKGNAAGIGPADQGFYKITAWVEEETGGKKSIVKVDPDGYCERTP